MDRAGALAGRWAREQNVELLQSAYRFLREEPFWWRSIEAQVVQLDDTSS